MAKDLSIYVFTYKKPSFDIIEDETHIPVRLGLFIQKKIFAKLKMTLWITFLKKILCIPS